MDLYISATFYSSKNVMDTARKHTVKKQAFGELKNVIHNQPSQSKSLKDVPNNHTRLTKPKQFGVLKPSVQHKQNIQNSQPTVRPFISSTVVPKNEEADIELLDYFDFAPKCCSKPYKSKFFHTIPRFSLHYLIFPQVIARFGLI